MIEDEPETPCEPDERAKAVVQPNEPEAPRSDAQAGLPGHATHFDPNRAVATSPPPPELQTGVPDLPLMSAREREAQAKAAEEQSEAAASTGGGATDAVTPGAGEDQ